MKLKLTALSMSLALCTYSQTPIGTPPTNNVNSQASAAWYRGGNFVGGTNPAGANIFGTLWNSPIYTKTNGKTHTRLNADLTTNIAGVNQNVDGYFGISHNPLSATSFFDTNSPWAMLHLDGPNNTNFGGDWRKWMRTGTFMRENSDAMYVGLKEEVGANRSDAVINWSDDANSAGGPDALRFIFTSTSDGNGGGNTNPRASSSLNGYEYMRMTPFPGITNSTGLPIGHVGIGPLFNTTQLPQNRLHMHAENSLANYMQISNEGATGQTANDGFHVGITTNGIAEIKQKENLDLRFFTNNTQQAVIKNTGWIGFNTNTPGNELEITSRATTPYGLTGSGLRFTNMKSTNAIMPNPGTGVLSVDANGDVIYVPGGSGSVTGNNGINFDVATNAVQLGGTCGNLKEMLNSALQTDRTILMADHNFWFANLNTDAGGVGVGGQPSSTPFCNVGNTFEISANMKNTKYGNIGASGLRFSKLTSASSVLANGTNGVDNTKVLSVDGDGDVVLINGSGSSTANADNGLSTNGPNPGAIHLGQSASGGAGGNLLDNREIPMNGFNMLWSGNGTSNVNRFAIGQNSTASAKMYVYDDIEANGILSELNANNSPLDLPYGPSGPRVKNAIRGMIHSNNNTPGGKVGVFGGADSDKDPVGVFGYAQGTANNVIGVMGSANGTGGYSYGGYFYTAGTSGTNYGVYSAAPTSGGINGPNYAGYFDGDLVYTGSFGMASDATLKTNIDTLPNALEIINQLKPKQFNFDQAGHPSMNLAGGLQYGLIAQEVETVLPVLVNNNVHPAKLDAAGNVTVPSVNFKSVEYEQLIPFLIKGIQQQQKQIEKQDSLINALASQINACCSNTSARNTNPTTNQLDVELSDKDAIVLDQNVPNPFAEQTTITYNVPESVSKAQIIFYNSNGQIIQTVDVKTRGKGKVNVFASDLSSGLYHYTLVADGKVVDSKKMVRE